MKQTKELIKDLNEWRKGKFHYCSSEFPKEENCHCKNREFGDMLCKDCYMGFRIRERYLEGLLDAFENEFKFLVSVRGTNLGVNEYTFVEQKKRIRELVEDIRKIKLALRLGTGCIEENKR